MKSASHRNQSKHENAKKLGSCSKLRDLEAATDETVPTASTSATHDPTATPATIITTSIYTEKLARKETYIVNVLRVIVLCVLLGTAISVASSVYFQTRNKELNQFKNDFMESASQVLDLFHEKVERNLAASSSLSTSITSYAQFSNQSFPFVNIPDFELKGSDLRALCGSHIVYYCPLVTDEQRNDWEDYALKHRWHINEASESDTLNRKAQDAAFGLSNDNSKRRDLHQGDHDYLTLQEPPPSDFTFADNVTGFHSKIWTNGAITPAGDEPAGTGPYLPLWQQSPVRIGMRGLNMNVANSQLVTRDMVDIMTTQKKAMLNHAAVPLPEYRRSVESLLSLSQYRHDFEKYIDDLHTILSYPVFDSFDVDPEERSVVGMIATDVYWDLLFSNILPSNIKGIIVVVENSLRQSFAYRIDGQHAEPLGLGDPHDPKYDDLEVSEELTSSLERRAGPQNRAYKTVSLSNSIQYTIRIYPSRTTEMQFFTQQPIISTIIVISAFAFASLLFVTYSYVVEKRQSVMTKRVIDNAKRAAETERELNEFLSHEIRNPLSAAMSASTFVAEALSKRRPLTDRETLDNAREDMEVVNSSLHFINDFLRSMLDIYRVNQITVKMAPTDILQDILNPVSNIMSSRFSNYDVLVDCPEHLLVNTDPIRLKQVVLNLVRNSSKFVERGFLRVRADVVDSFVRLYVEDSGPGIPLEKQKQLFAKYQESLDLQNQGTGIGLNLSKKLMTIMGGELALDPSYRSGIPGCPGSCFVLQLNKEPIDIESTLQMGDSSDVLPTSPHSSMTEIQSPKCVRTSLTGELITSPRSLDRRSADKQPTPMISPLSSPKASPRSSSHRDAQDGSTSSTSSTRSGDADELPEGLSVLFVDDDAVLRKLFIRAVKKAAPESWTIKEASSGEMALRLCESDKFDMICLDQYMASADKQLLGTETAQAMRSKGIQSRICGLSANDLRDAFINAGADDFALKPIPCKPGELKLLLQRILSSKRPL